MADIRQLATTDRALLERLIPATYVACTVRITEMFNQSPGPGAGAPLAR